MSEKKLELGLKFKDILLTAINEYVTKNPQPNLGSLSARENLSLFLASYLSPYIDEYEDEINSLWFMLDELKKSDAALRGPAFAKEVEDMIDVQMASLKLMQNQKGEA